MKDAHISILSFVIFIQFVSYSRAYDWCVKSVQNDSTYFKLEECDLCERNEDYELQTVKFPPPRKMFNFNGEKIPLVWSRKWADVEFVSLREAELGYWIRWRGNILNVVLEVDYEGMDTRFYHKLNSAIFDAADKFIKSFGLSGDWVENISRKIEEKYISYKKKQRDKLKAKNKSSKAE